MTRFTYEVDKARKAGDCSKLASLSLEWNREKAKRKSAAFAYVYGATDPLAGASCSSAPATSAAMPTATNPTSTGSVAAGSVTTETPAPAAPPAPKNARDTWHDTYGDEFAKAECARGFKGKHGADRDFPAWCSFWGHPWGPAEVGAAAAAEDAADKAADAAAGPTNPYYGSAAPEVGGGWGLADPVSGAGATPWPWNAPASKPAAAGDAGGFPWGFAALVAAALVLGGSKRPRARK